MLTVEDIHTYYGSSHILHGVNLSLNRGEAVSVMGRNGAGKTTLMRTIMGLTAAGQGSVVFSERDITGSKPHEVFRLGIRLVPQGRNVFPKLTVEENLQLALVAQRSVDSVSEIAKAYDRFPILGQRRQQRVRNLSGGERQMLAIARGLLGETVILLMDEPSEGLAPLVVRALHDTILEIKMEGITILLAEQNVKMALSACGRHYILEKGEIRFKGDTEAVSANRDIMRQTLGVSA
jgi:branched-chain amino acid transport system ATP-binding protein